MINLITIKHSWFDKYVITLVTSTLFFKFTEDGPSLPPPLVQPYSSKSLYCKAAPSCGPSWNYILLVASLDTSMFVPSWNSMSCHNAKHVQWYWQWMEISCKLSIDLKSSLNSQDLADVLDCLYSREGGQRNSMRHVSCERNCLTPTEVKGHEQSHKGITKCGAKIHVIIL
jgi:hypothetical protein